MLSLINLQSTKNQSAKEGDPRRQPHSSENWCRPAGLDSFPLCFPALTCRAFLCRRFAPGAMAQSTAPSKLSGNQLNQSPLRKVIHHPVVLSSLDRDHGPDRRARLMACFSSGVNRRTEPFFRSPSSSGPIDTRTRRKTRTSSFSSRRRICRFLPSSSVISSQLFLSPCRSRRAPLARKCSLRSPSTRSPSTAQPRSILASRSASATRSTCTWYFLSKWLDGSVILAAHSELLVNSSSPSLALSSRPTGPTHGSPGESRS